MHYDLIEDGHDIARGARVGTTYRAASPNIELHATVSSVHVWLRLDENEVQLTHTELTRLASATHHWLRARKDWGAVLDFRHAWPGRGGAAYVQEPGRWGARREVYNVSQRGERGRPLNGEEREDRLGEPIRVCHGVTVMAELRRVGDSRLPEGGMRVGLRYDLGDDLSLFARRGVAELCRAEASAFVIPAEEARFMFALQNRVDARQSDQEA